MGSSACRKAHLELSQQFDVLRQVKSLELFVVSVESSDEKIYKVIEKERELIGLSYLVHRGAPIT